MEGVETSWQAPDTKGNFSKVKVWSRPQISSLTRAAKAVDGTHNLEVIGSNPVPATCVKRVSRLRDALFPFVIQQIVQKWTPAALSVTFSPFTSILNNVAVISNKLATSRLPQEVSICQTEAVYICIVMLISSR